MQTSQGTLAIIDPHGELKVFWNGQPVPATSVAITNHYVFITVPEDVVLPAGIDALDNIKVRRQR